MEQKFILNEKLKEKIEKILGGRFSYALEIEDIECLIEDLVYQYHKLKEEYEDYQATVSENYKPISKHEQFDINENDFH